ncbi:hypothetical protein WJX73_007550 [Symbiochloris irregularis]|uniref:1,4-alpha-glucan branching enzyme n=1 Tax=Symbiochloris irregularis TaxID=706552 RepID=A0AAW1NS14_9CHLO
MRPSLVQHSGLRFCPPAAANSRQYGFIPDSSASAVQPEAAGGRFGGQLSAGRQGTARKTSQVRASDRQTKLDILKKENDALRAALDSVDATASVDELENQLKAGGIDTEKLKQQGFDARSLVAGNGQDAKTSEDYWSPQVPVEENFKDDYGEIPPVPDHDGTICLKWDQSLGSHADHFRYRWNVYKGMRASIDKNEGGLAKFSEGYKIFGLNRGVRDGKEGIWYREWAPGARALALVGEFNNWDPKDNHWAVRNDFGVWELFLPDEDGTSAIPHRSRIKARLETAYGEWVERIPAWVKWATQTDGEVQFNGVYWAPPKVGKPGEEPSSDQTYTFSYKRPPRPRALRIYECHVGMSSQEPKINSYLEFKQEVLPRIRNLGYNAIQIMAIQEHAYYGSFGYHVTNFFAASSRCGTPEELKALIDEAHRLGMVVLMDIVHSHASKNTNDGISMFDGTDAQYFHSGGRGYHWMWDSRCFNYGNWETLRFLLSNTRWWMDEYKFDGYRFDGVTSMLYHHHGLKMAFTGNYDEYFGMATDVEAVVYMMLMNEMLHSLFPTAITVGEDVSGMPTLCRPVAEGGIGFNYRLQMAIADKWIEVLSEHTDDTWDIGNIVHTLTNRRYAEPCIAYAESHDQALVGDKTIAFWLMDKEMYFSMATNTPSSVVDRGVALHKMIRLLTLALGGESYLNFMGNEFGHPEWIDFPRDDSYDTSTGKLVKGNGGSLEKCRRRWDLADAEFLKYRFMNAWDRAMQHLDKAFGFVCSPHEYVSRKDEGDKLIVVERGDLVMVFNFHPVNSFSDYRIGCPNAGEYKCVLSSDEEIFGGYENASKKYDVTYTTQEGNYDNRPHSFMAYAPSRTVAVYAPAQYADAKADQNVLGVPGLGVKDRGPAFER